MSNQPRLFVKLAVLAAMAGASTSAQAESYDIKVRAFVPTSCSADFVANFSQVGTDSFSLGTINQFCNTRFQLSLMHNAVTSTGSASLGGNLANLGTTETVLKAVANPIANASELLVLHGVDSTTADQFQSIMVVSIAPIAF